MLNKLDALGIADNTIVMYSTDNGPENDTWPDGGNTPFNGQKDSNWEGAWRVPSFMRWPGKIKAGTVFNGICSHQDMLPTLLAAAGDRSHEADLSVPGPRFPADRRARRGGQADPRVICHVMLFSASAASKVSSITAGRDRPRHV